MAAAHGTLWYSATVWNCAQTKQHEMMDVVLPYRTATSSMKTTSPMAGTLLLTPTLAIRYPCTRAGGDGTTMDRCCASRCLGAWRHAHEQHRKLTFLSFQLTFLSCAEAHHTVGFSNWGAGGGGAPSPSSRRVRVSSRSASRISPSFDCRGPKGFPYREVLWALASSSACTPVFERAFCVLRTNTGYLASNLDARVVYTIQRIGR